MNQLHLNSASINPAKDEGSTDEESPLGFSSTNTNQAAAFNGHTVVSSQPDTDKKRITWEDQVLEPWDDEKLPSFLKEVEGERDKNDRILRYIAENNPTKDNPLKNVTKGSPLTDDIKVDETSSEMENLAQALATQKKKEEEGKTGSLSTGITQDLQEQNKKSDEAATTEKSSHSNFDSFSNEDLTPINRHDDGDERFYDIASLSARYRENEDGTRETLDMHGASMDRKGTPGDACTIS